MARRRVLPEGAHFVGLPDEVGDAIEELQSDGQAFHVFLEEDSGRVEIAFRRSDGSVGIIEPVVP